MARLTWDARYHEFGIDRGVFYPRSGAGEAWSGLISVTESPSDSSNKAGFQDGLRRTNCQSSGYFAGTLSAYSYPSTFYNDILLQRRPSSFGFSYRTMVEDHYQIHIVYNVLITPEQYIHDQSTVVSYSWGFTALPVDISGAKRSSHLVIDTSIAYPWVIEAIEDILYGTEGDAPRLPTSQEILDLFEANAILRITDNGDGTWTAETDEDGIISMLDVDTFEITWPSAVYLDANTYTISSL